MLARARAELTRCVPSKPQAHHRAAVRRAASIDGGSPLAKTACQADQGAWARQTKPTCKFSYHHSVARVTCNPMPAKSRQATIGQCKWAQTLELGSAVACFFHHGLFMPPAKQFQAGLIYFNFAQFAGSTFFFFFFSRTFCVCHAGSRSAIALASSPTAAVASG